LLGFQLSFIFLRQFPSGRTRQEEFRRGTVSEWKSLLRLVEYQGRLVTESCCQETPPMKGSTVWIIVAHVIAWVMAAPVVSALLTPSPDFITMSLIWLAVGGVFEVVFLMYWFLIRRKP
jgi:hypothetical protein